MLISLWNVLMVLFLNGATTFPFSPDCELVGCSANTKSTDDACSVGSGDERTEMTPCDTEDSISGKSNSITNTHTHTQTCDNWHQHLCFINHYLLITKDLTA